MCIVQITIYTYYNFRNRNHCSASSYHRTRNQKNTRTGNSLLCTAVRDNGAPYHGGSIDNDGDDGPSSGIMSVWKVY